MSKRNAGTWNTNHLKNIPTPNGNHFLQGNRNAGTWTPIRSQRGGGKAGWIDVVVAIMIVMLIALTVMSIFNFKFYGNITTNTDTLVIIKVSTLLLLILDLILLVANEGKRVFSIISLAILAIIMYFISNMPVSVSGTPNTMVNGVYVTVYIFLILLSLFKLYSN